MKIIDCATDSIVDSLPISARNATLALDALHNQLYVGATDSFRVIDCNRDSVIARYYSLRKAQAICCQPTARKVYVAAGESLFALSTNTNSIVYRQRYDTLSAQLACDPVHNRVYYSYWGSLVALDCASDSVVWNVDLSARAIALAAVPNQDKLCIMIAGFGDSWEYVLDGATGQNLWYFSPTLQEDSLCYASIADRVCVFSQNRAVSMLNVRAGTLDGIIPLGAPVSEVVADSTNDKLYFLASYTANACRIGVVDCYSRKVKSYSRILGGVLFTDRRCMSLDLRDQKLYCCLDSSIYVLDCGTDSVVKAIPTGNNFVMAMVWHPVLNKIYAVSPTEQRKFRLSVLDCSDDSVTSASDLSGTWAEGYTAFVDTVLNQFWLVYGGYTVVNCANDSVITETGATFRDYKTAGSDFDNHRVYVASRHTLYVIDTETRLPIDSIVIEPTEYGESRQVFCVPVAGKVFWTVQYVFPPIVDSVLAVDTHCDSIVARFTIPFYGALCDGRAGDYVYSSDCYEYLIAIDARTDSIVSGVHIPLGATYLVRNSSTNRLYALGLNDSVIQVVYDSVIFAGVRAKPTSTSRTWRPQTLLSRSTALRSPADAILFDATGRGVSVLTRGRNDISRLAPGVYFVREGMQASGSKSQTVLKVVIAR